MYMEEMDMRGRAYRRTVKAKKDRRLRRILHDCRCTPYAGYIRYDWIDGVRQPVGDYIRYPKHSNMQKYLKRLSNRTVRRSKTFPRGNAYRKCIEYRWQFW
jgi:hypothetical protein